MSEIIFLIFLGVILFSIPKIFSEPKVGLWMLMVALPFERIPTYELSFASGVTVRLSQIIALLVIISLLVRFLKKEIEIKYRLEYFLLFLYLAVAFLSIFFAGNQERAIMVWLFTAFVIITSFAVSFLVKEKKDLETIEKVLYWVALFVCLFGAFQFVGSTFGLSDEFVLLRSEYGATTKRLLGFPRVQSFSLEPLYYANFLLIPFGLFFMKSLKKLSRKNIVILFLITLNFVLTFSRGIYLAGIITILIACILGLKISTYKKIGKSLLVISVALVLGVAMLTGSSYVKNQNFSQIEKAVKHATDISDDSVSVPERKDSWENAIDAFKERPIIGVGIGNFGYWEAGSPEEAPKRGWNIVNNETLEVLSETGLLGFLSLMGALFYIFLNGVGSFNTSKDKDLRIWLTGLLVSFIGIAAQYQTFSTLYIMHVWVLIGMLMAVSRINRASEG